MGSSVKTFVHGTPHGYNYHRCRCVDCKKWRVDYNRAYTVANPEKMRQLYRRRSLKQAFGLTEADYDAMLAAQHGGCAICSAPEPTGRKRFLEVDHNHTTGAIRGLLCTHCNQAIGRLKDDPELMRNAIAYLERYA